MKSRLLPIASVVLTLVAALAVGARLAVSPKTPEKTPVAAQATGLGELRGPMADETMSWLNRIALGLPTPAATVEEAHKNLMLTKALDLSAKRKQPVKLPLDPEEEKRAA